jgi:Arc/MetJ family transcription regulator
VRTNIDIDDKLMKQAMKATGARTKRAAVEASLRQTVQLKKQESIRRLFGKLVWRGHDDDWSVSDEEIVSRRRAAAALADIENRKPPVAVEREPARKAGRR